MKTYRLVSQFLVAIILSYCFSACTTEAEEFFVQDGSIRLRSEIVSTSRVTDQSLQSIQIVEGQQVGVTITGAASEHENVAWVVGKNGSLSNTGTAVYWGATDATSQPTILIIPAGQELTISLPWILTRAQMKAT